MAATDLPRQLFAEHVQLLPFRRANMRREVSIDFGPPPLRCKENQLRKLGGSQPRETTAIAETTQAQAPVAIEAVDGAASGVIHPRRALQREISKDTNLVDGRPWRGADVLVRP